MADAKRFSPSERASLKGRAEKVLDRLRPALQADGGDAQILDVTEDGRLLLKLLGACGGCPMSPLTLKQGIEKVMHADIPELHEVVAQ